MAAVIIAAVIAGVAALMAVVVQAAAGAVAGIARTLTTQIRLRSGARVSGTSNLINTRI